MASSRPSVSSLHDAPIPRGAYTAFDASEPQDDRRLRSIRGAVLVLAAGTTLGGAAMLEPDARGFGTHEQLGFDACPAARAGHPCPHCGILTSVVHGVHGEIGESLRTHGGGLPIVLALAWAFVVGIVELMPRPILSRRVRRAVGLTLVLAAGLGAMITVAERFWHEAPRPTAQP